MMSSVGSNVLFTSTYPPSMALLGADLFRQCARQYVDIAFHQYNRWTMVINSHNSSGICRLDKPFQCTNDQYKLKIGQIADDGIMSTTNTAEVFAKVVHKSLTKLKHLWEIKESFPSEKHEVLLPRKGWEAVRQADNVYLQAFGGTVQASKVDKMPFFSRIVNDADTAKGNRMLIKQKYTESDIGPAELIQNALAQVWKVHPQS